MIRTVLDFTFLLLFVWACMILGLWTIDSYIVPMPLPDVKSDTMTAVLKVAISAAMVLFWLWLWREIVKRMFWRTIRSQQQQLIVQSQNINKRQIHNGIW